MGNIHRTSNSVIGVQRLARLSNALMAKIPKSNNCGAGILMGSAERFILQHMYRYQIELSESLSLITSAKLGGTTILSGFPYIPNLLDYV